MFFYPSRWKLLLPVWLPNVDLFLKTVCDNYKTAFSFASSPTCAVLAWKESCEKDMACDGDSLAPITFLLSLQWSPPWLLKCLITNTFFELSKDWTSTLCSFQIALVKEAHTFSILQLHKESMGNNRQGRNMAMMWSTSHCSASWATFAYINCWLKHHRLVQAKRWVWRLLFSVFALLSLTLRSHEPLQGKNLRYLFRD